VRVLNQEARSYFASAAREVFDLIQMSPVDAFGASGAGLYASQESYLYTMEAIGSMLDHLSPGGVLSITRWAKTPPRDELRTFDTAIRALCRCGLDPSERLAMIRSWATVTVLVFKEPISPARTDALRRFCRDRSFDICYLPGLRREEANLYHLLDRPYYFDAAQSLLGPHRERFLADYLFEIAATTDDKPYFFHSFRWRSMSVLSRQLHSASRAFLELGYLMAMAALFQTAAAGGLLILVPLAPGVGALRHARGRAPSLGYFLLLGAGFMLLEMGFLQEFMLYLGHPIYSAALVISSFLIFAGLGSQFSASWREPKRVIIPAAAVVVSLSLAYLLGMDTWLRPTQALPITVRFVIAGATIAPLALAMGHMFPAGLRQAGQASACLVPWAWAVNGFASVVATVAAPLLAMSFGFSCLILFAIACYALAGILSRALPDRAA
jgi:hypothetical protein